MEGQKMGKLKRSKLDKWISGLLTIGGTVILFVIDNLSSFFSDRPEVQYLITFISALSLFCFVWSFIWENKIEAMRQLVITHETNFTKTQIESVNKLREYINLLLADADRMERVESRVLHDLEINIASALQINSDSSDYAQIYIITNDTGVENNNFGDAICNNIINNHQYVYITPLDDDLFLNKLSDTLFKTKPPEIDKNHLKAAIAKNVRHIRDKTFFNLLPVYSDIVIYTNKKLVAYNKAPDKVIGYYSFQNSAVIVDNATDCYFYTKMLESNAKEIVDTIEIKLSKRGNKPNLSAENYLSKSVEKCKSRYYDGYGLICVQPISANETIFKKGGIFIDKSKLDENLKQVNMYLQVSNRFVVSSLKVHEDTMLGFPITHSCRMPNCGFKTPIEIVAIKDIAKGEEILIDYAFFDPDYIRFSCKCCSNEDCTRKNQSAEQIIATLNRKYLSPYLRERITGGN